MKLEIDTVLSPAAAGPARGNFMIIPPHVGPLGEKVPGSVAFVIVGDGKTVRIMLEAAESIGLGQMALVCGCFLEGGPPPVAAAPEPFKPIIFNGGKH